MGTSGNSLGTMELLRIVQETQDAGAFNQLVANYLPLVQRISQKFSHSGESMEDLVQVRAIGLVKAIKKYDVARGNDLVAFAIPAIVSEIKNYFRDHGWAVKVPRHIQRHKMVVDRAIQTLAQSLGRWPKVAEIAHDTGLSEEQVYETFELERCGKPLYLDSE